MNPTRPNAKNQGNNVPTERKKGLVVPILGIVVSIILLFLAWWIATRPTPTTVPVDKKNLISQKQIDVFFDEQVKPALHDYEIRNIAAVDQAVDRITERVDAYKEGIPNFVEDITSWGTRIGIIGRSSRELCDKSWGDDENERRVYEYVSAKFEKYLFSDAKLRDLVQSSLAQFRDDLHASQNILHADIKTAWDAGPLASQKFDTEKVVSLVQADVSDIFAHMATDSVTVGVLSFVGGFALEEATTALVRVIVARVAAYLATSAATTTATSGGATSTAAVAGAAGGSTIGPWGTVIGVTAGLVVGIVSDWWMSSQLEKKLTRECEEMIDKVKSHLLFGSDDDVGMKHAFIESINIFQNVENEAIHTALMEVAR